jgi:DNA-binding NarL/FixJ family response regulator
MMPPFSGRRFIRMKGNKNQLPDSSQPQLSQRELEVIALLARGNPNKIIAETLGISIRTVEVHRSSIMHKLDFRSMSDLVIYAVRNKIIDLDI